MDDSESFTLLPIYMDPTSKTVTTSSNSRVLQEELEALNVLHKTMNKELDGPVPPPPVPMAPKRSGQITKLKETGNQQFRKQEYVQATRTYDIGVQMALTRPDWEPSGLKREEAAEMFANRAQAHMALRNWVEGSIDAEKSIEAKKAGNPKAWWRKAKCLMEMGRVEEAREWVDRGLEMDGNESDLVSLLKELEARDQKKA